MKRIDLKTGFSCNNYCRFCIQGNKRDIHPDKSTQEIKTILKKSRKEADSIVFTGGEPAFRPKLLLEWVKYAKKIGYKTIQIQTNGRMFAYKDYCRNIIEAGANEFGPALHGSNSQIHDYLTRAPGSWEQTVQGIKNLKSLRQYVLTNSVICKPNYKDLPDLAKLLVDLKVDQFQLAFIHINEIIAHDQVLIEEMIPRYLEVEPYVKKGLQVGINAKISVMAEAMPFCFMKGYEDYISEKVIPDSHVFDADFEVKDYSKYRKTHAKIKGPNCQKCKYYNICEGPWKEYPQIFGWDEFKPIIA